eukprot:CAMPEP_0117012746 /NCGR_PEP_ID=MMETSP0472-20121206/10660_1 /TAXON_ID=693140 ORGANISM="Tiarina fusus, Strain LIS" /NCGR_SAMPLE_ID=MMETSP0472 /ASSEMBLY_ACC=CAM_ASM_000603 /LENGTH=624 /DNA_ID=CAMNT_0004715891 /DNA_START=29 /DNA_END=1903 /DNA_ORIENTATION=+
MAEEVKFAQGMALSEGTPDQGTLEEDAETEECRDHMTPLPTAIEGHGHRRRRCSELMEPLSDVADLEYDIAVPSPGGQRRKSRASRRTSELIELGSVDFSVKKSLNLSYRPTDFQFYRPPKQRQRWGQTQVLPRVNWGDLFFDLFYVAAGYNTSNILVESPNSLGCLYFLATFLSVMHPWVMQTIYDARFVVMDDMYHRVTFVAFLCALASAVVHIRPVDILSQPSKYIDAFALYLSLSVLTLIGIIREAELYFFGKGEKEAIQTAALRGINFSLINFSLNLAATIVAGTEYFGTDGDHRLLAEAGPTDVNHLPVWLSFAGFLGFWVLFKAKLIFFFPNDGSHKKTFTPMNIDFNIHRYSEWTMLMLGESILSLLIVDVPQENQDYFVTFYNCLVLVILLQYLHFRSQPHHADDHASRRDKNRGSLWTGFQFVYSAALISLGAAMTLFVLSFTYEASGGHRLLEEVLPMTEDRQLAGGGAPLYPPDEMEMRAANLFSISLTAVLFSLDSMSFLHVGWADSKKRCQRHSKGLKIMANVVLVTRCGLLVFTATLSQWIYDADKLSGLGLGVVLAQIVCRKLGEKYLSPKDDDEESVDDEGNKWPNVTQARAEPASEEPTEQAAEHH